MPSVSRTRGAKRPKGPVPVRSRNGKGAARGPARRPSAGSGRSPKASTDRPDRPPRRPASEPGQSRAARRRAARRRRDRLLLVGSVVVSALVVAAWFPASALYHQHQELGSTTAHLHQVRTEDAALHQEEHRLGNPAEVARIAREQYQLVDPGQQAYEVLPPSGGAGGSYEGDPGLQAPVLPSGASELPPGEDGSAPAGGQDGGSKAGTTAKAHTGSGKATASQASANTEPSSFVGRIAQTLEFWR